MLLSNFCLIIFSFLTIALPVRRRTSGMHKQVEYLQQKLVTQKVLLR